jgi:periplasmic divalent cation tolerance protein
MKEEAVLIYCTVSDNAEARSIARLLVEKRLAACCSIINNVASVYIWDDKIEEDSESLLLIKTSHRKYEQVEKEIKMVHSYSVPEIIATPITEASKAYLDWIFKNTEDV